MKHSFVVLLVFLSLVSVCYSQNHSGNPSPQPQPTEIYFRFTIHDKSELRDITRIISIDNVKGNVVTAYANPEEFRKFSTLGYDITRLPNPGFMYGDAAVMTGPTLKYGGSGIVWNFYPTYDEYITYMNDFAANNPAICKLINFGSTVQGRQLLMVKISDSVNYTRKTPRVLLTSSMHGDETVGYVEMLHLIDSLLSGYGNNTRITNLLNNYEIYINPLANPDGTYHGGNNTVYGATRGNANGVDLNRNYPNMAMGSHPDGNPWQPETISFMAIADSDFVMSMNFHGGAEVYNYPWDTWPRLHADDEWWQFTGREYADTVHKYAPAGYMDDEQNGVTDGYAWYVAYGTRQDYTTYYKYGREVTLEISSTKTIPNSQLYRLLYYWDYNKRSFLDYIEQSGYGINGQITDSVTGKPLYAKVFIFGHDKDNSFVFSHLPTGMYYRTLIDSSYDVTFTCDGYHSKTITGIPVVKYQTTRVNVPLVPLNFGGVADKEIRKLDIFPNPAVSQCRVVLPENAGKDYVMDIFDITGKKVTSLQGKCNPGYPFIQIDVSGFSKGSYVVQMTSGDKIFEGKIFRE